MDNFRIDVTSEGREALQFALKIAFLQLHKGKATHYVKHPRQGLILLYAKEGEAQELPIPMGAYHCGEMILGWLELQDYGQPPDIDGDCKKGWRLFNEPWKMVEEYRFAICAVRPAWAMYGK